MSALFIVVPLALIVSACAVGAFVWAVRRGELDDLDTPALRMLEDDMANRAEVAAPAPGSGRQSATGFRPR